MPVTNPIRLLYSALWDILEAQSDFAAGVPAGNRIKYSETPRPPDPKDTLSTADYPNVRLVARGLQSHHHRTSNSSTLAVLWEIQVSSGDTRFQTLFDVEWWIFRAMAGWEAQVTDVKWEGKELVNSCRTLEAETELGDPKLDRGNRGWSTVWAGVTELWITTADL
jgi:hypothetical protein